MLLSIVFSLCVNWEARSTVSAFSNCFKITSIGKPMCKKCVSTSLPCMIKSFLSEHILLYLRGSEKLYIFYVHRMTAGVMEIVMVVSICYYKLVDIVPLLILITTNKNDTAVVEYSCAKLMFGNVLITFSRKDSNVPPYIFAYSYYIL